MKNHLAPIGIVIIAVVLTLTLFCTVGCGVPWPTIQSKTIVFGLELETMGSLTSGESPLPKLRTGLIFHEGQVVQADTAAKLYSDYSDLNLWTASGTMKGIMLVAPESSIATDSDKTK